MLAFQNRKIKITADLKILRFQNREFKILGDLKILAFQILNARFWAISRF